MGNSLEFRELLVKMHIDRMTKSWGAYAIQTLFGYAKPIWDGKCEEGKTILIVGEGGLGDEMFAAISQLDLTISSSTCIPIVCAGLNKPVWTVVPKDP